MAVVVEKVVKAVKVYFQGYLFFSLQLEPSPPLVPELRGPRAPSLCPRLGSAQSSPLDSRSPPPS